MATKVSFLIKRNGKFFGKPNGTRQIVLDVDKNHAYVA